LFAGDEGFTSLDGAVGRTCTEGLFADEGFTEDEGPFGETGLLCIDWPAVLDGRLFCDDGLF
jgi:hypothetical protein